jgi:hypothetical protein
MKRTIRQCAAWLGIAILVGCGGEEGEVVYCEDCGPTTDVVYEGEGEYVTDFAITAVVSDAWTGWPVAGADVRFAALYGRSDDVILATDAAGHAAYAYSEVYPAGVDPVSGWVVEIGAPGYAGFTSGVFELSIDTPTAVFDVELAPGY